jgi:hypothetical protein
MTVEIRDRMIPQISETAQTVQYARSTDTKSFLGVDRRIKRRKFKSS